MADVEIQRESFVFYSSFYSAIITLPEEEQLIMFKAVIERALYGKEPSLKGCAKGMYDLISPQLKANERRYFNGRKGGAPVGNQNAKKTTEKQPENNLKTTEKQPNDNVNVNDNENANGNVNFNVITPTATKHKHGTYNNVLLTDEEYLKLQERFPTDYEEKINTLSEGIALKGYKYKSHYLAVIRWAMNDANKTVKKTASSNPFLDLLREG